MRRMLERGTMLGWVFALLMCTAAWLAPTAFASDSIYWTSYTNPGAVRLGDLGGAGARNLLTGESSPEGVAIDPAAGKIYWADTTAGSIRVANLDGTGAHDLYTGESEPSGVAIDPAAGLIYWADAVSGSGTIRVGNLDGSGARTLFARESYPVGVAIDPAAGKIYWGSYDTFKIRAGNLDGTGAHDLFTGENYPTGLAIDPAAGKLYWTNEFAGNIRVGNLDGTGATSLYTGETTVGGLAIDPTSGKIYWGGWGSAGTIRVGSLNGSAPAQSLYTGENDPWFVALLRAPLGTGGPQVSGGGGVGQTLSCSGGSWAADLVSGFLFRAPQSVAYQWTVGGAPIAGATTSTLFVSSPGSYECELIASNAAGSTTQTSAPATISAAKLPPPVLGRKVNATPVGGKVFALIDGRLVPLTATRQIRSGAVVDALHGTISLTSATGKGKKTQTGTFGGAVFKVTQVRAGTSKGLTTLTLVNNAFKGAPSYATCKSHTGRDASAAALSSRTLQLLHASAHGKFRTGGRYGAATVRGTIWSIADRCDGTLVHDVTDSVLVNDFVRHRSIVLRAGQSYLARKPK
jgi:hypothetical protein